MADLKASFFASNYIPDRGADTNPLALKGNFVVPVGMTQSLAETIATFAGLTLSSFNGTKISSAPIPPPCAMRGLYHPRKIKFFLDNEKSFSIPVVDKTNAVVVGRNIKQVIENNTAFGRKVLCCQYIGEEWKGLIDILSTSAKPGLAAFITDPRGESFAESYLYQTDQSTSSVPLRFKVESELNDELPSVIKTQWELANPQETDRKPCSGAKQRYESRRYILEYLVNRNGKERASRVQVPVSLRNSSDIRVIGESLADEAYAICLSYKGESDRYFQLALK